MSHARETVFDRRQRRWRIIIPSRPCSSGDWWLEVYRADDACTTRYWLVEGHNTLDDAVRAAHQQVRAALRAEREKVLARESAACVPAGCRCDPLDWAYPERIPPTCPRFEPMRSEPETCRNCEHLEECHG